MVICSMLVPSEMAALLIRISQRPWVLSTWAASAATFESSPMSTANALASPPDSRIRRAASCAAFSLMSAMMTIAPSWASRVAMPNPMPCAPPVTTAIRLFNLCPALAMSALRVLGRLGDLIALHDVPIDLDAQAGLSRQRNGAIRPQQQFLLRQFAAQAFVAKLRRQIFDEGAV